MMVMPDQFKTQEICNEAVHVEPNLMAYAPDCSKTQEICNEAVAHNPCTLRFIPDHFRTLEMCNLTMCIKSAEFFSYSRPF